MASDNIQNPASRLQRIEDMIQTLKLVISILRPFLRCIFKWQFACQTLKVHFDNILESQVLNVIWDFQPYGSGWTQVLADETWKSSPRTAELVASSLTELKLIRPDMIGIYGIVSRASRSISSDSTKYVVINNIAPLLENLKDLLRCKADVIVHVREEIEELAEKLREMKLFLSFVGNQCRVPERMRYLWAHAEIVAVNATCLLYFCLMEDNMEAIKALAMKNDLSELIQKIKPASPEVRELYTDALKTLTSLKVDAPIIDQHVLSFVDYLIDNLKDLSNNKESFVIAKKNQIEVLLEELRLLRYNLLDPPLQAATEECEAHMIVEIINVINETGYFVYLSRDNEKKEAIVGELSHLLSCLLTNIKCISENAPDIDGVLAPRLSVFSYPCRTSEISTLYIILAKVEDMLHRKVASCNPLKHQIEIVLKELLSLKDNFDQMEKWWKRNETFQSLLGQSELVAEYAERLISSFLRSSRSIWWLKLGLFHVIKEIKLIQNNVKAFQAKMSNDKLFYNRKHSTGMVSSQPNPPKSYSAEVSKNEVGNTNQIVGLKEEAETLIEKLTRGSEQLQILSIVGMPGLGKTTLANLVYQHRLVSLHFHVRASCCVSQIYQKDTLLRELLCQISGETNEGNENDTEDFAEQLRKCLKGRRYFVIMDDVWDIKAWHDLAGCFPDDNNGSRILITTTQHKVASEARYYCQSLHLLADQQSWKLLRIKIFREESCPPELIQVGKCIAKDCRGLPLAVVLLAGLLLLVERTQDCWEQIAYRLRSHVNIYRHVYDTLELSYNYLPNYLKPCFLNLGLLVPHTEIPVKKLVRLWMAQGFVQQSGVSQNSLEHEAENYLNDLISRCLVMVSKRSSKDTVKTCCVHDVIQDFCFAKAKQETLVQQQDMYDGLSSFSDCLMHDTRRPSILPGINVSHSAPYFRRSSCPQLEQVRFDYVTDMTVVTRSRSATSTPAPRNSPFKKLNLKFFNSGVRCRVLDLENVPIECCASTDDLVLIAKLVHLRYLAVRICTKKIPSAVSYLSNLQTLILNGAIGDELELPDTIWEIMTLRHILMEDAFFRFPQNFSENLGELANLKTISTVRLPCGNATGNIVRRLPSLQKLRCRLSDSLDDSISCNHFPTLDTLTQLESLKVFFGQMLRNCKFSLPSQLKKLTLSNSCLPWNEISTIGRLPNLVVLKLLDRSFEGHQWDMEEGEFQKLKFLKLDLLNIAQWNFSSEHLPSLEHLVVQRCKKLKELPFTLGEIPTVRIIEVKDCDRSVMHSIRLIEEDQRQMGNKELKVYIKM